MPRAATPIMYSWPILKLFTIIMMCSAKKRKKGVGGLVLFFQSHKLPLLQFFSVCGSDSSANFDENVLHKVEKGGRRRRAGQGKLTPEIANEMTMGEKK